MLQPPRQLLQLEQPAGRRVRVEVVLVVPEVPEVLGVLGVARIGALAGPIGCSR